MLIKNVYGVFKYAPKAAQNSPMMIVTNSMKIVVPSNAFKKSGELRSAIIKKLKAAGINW